MLNFESFKLANGLSVIVHEDVNSQVAVVNVMYDVGSRDEDVHKTGLAHLVEHLMFGGSKHIPAYDSVLQQVGGDNNAYTTPDVTNYYCILPAVNLETAFWLESDRMLGLSLEPQAFAIQQKVVIEEFKERYLNQPYGDAWLKLMDLAYTSHPYRWPTIGKHMSHIENATIEDVKAFFDKFYLPTNAVLVVAGRVKLAEVKRLSQKWFASIPAGPAYTRHLPQEPMQHAPRKLIVAAPVPLNALYKAYHVPARLSKDYPAVELICSILGSGKSSRGYEQLVATKKYFNTIDVYTTASFDPGLLIISGRLNDGVSFEKAEAAIHEVIRDIQHIKNKELCKVQNQTETYLTFEAVQLLHRAQELAMATLLGDTTLVNREIEQIQNVTVADIKDNAQRIFKEDNCTTIYYQCKPAMKTNCLC